MNRKLHFLILLGSFYLFSCSSENKNVFFLQGKLDYLGESEFYLEKPPLHYKYSQKSKTEIQIDEEGKFNVAIPLQHQEIVWLVLDDKRFPIIADAGNELHLTITRSDFPDNIIIQSEKNEAYQAYQNYLRETNGLDKAIELEMNNFKADLPNTALELSKKKITIATSHLTNTPFSSFILKAQGEYLVNRIKSVEYQFYKKSFNADLERKSVLNEAKELGFFSLESLEAQRAGIRDFTHYYARTFDIYDVTKKQHGEDLAEYDIKRLAYEDLNEKRLEVIQQIEDTQAEAYARMFLVAERIGEIPVDIAKPSYKNYLEEYSEFEEYTDFLTYFYNEIKSVSPGQPAIPFTLKDDKGIEHSMDKYKGKYVLLDFWAGWCQPCLEEFPEMRRIYTKYPRDTFEILGISTEVDEDVWRYDIQRFRNPWVQLYGGNGFEQETFKAYKGGGIPFYILVDPDGNIARYNDIRATFNLEAVLDELILN